MNFRFTFPRFGGLFILLILSVLFGGASLQAATGQESGIRAVVIDAGHGGPKYPGASYGGHHEKNINLQIALKLGKLIEQEMPSVKVIYTRTTDKQFSTDLNADLQARADIANRAEADLFISIHANAARSTAARGVETLIMGESEKETRINESVLYANNKEEFLDMSDERTAAIVRAYIQNLQFTYGQYSEALARLVQSNYEKAGYHSRGVKRQPLKVLYATDMPSILTEVGFMSNAADLKQMTTSSGQMTIARALLGAVKDYDAYVRETRLQEETTPVAATAPKPEVKPEPKPEPKPAPKPAEAQPLQRGYTIQVMASATSLSVDRSEFKTYRGKVKEYRAQGRYSYKYCYGTYSSKGAAAADLAAVRRVFKDAYVVHFEGGEIK